MVTGQYVVCRVDPGLVDHVRQLLSDAAVTSDTARELDGTVSVTVDPTDSERARAVIGLVLPGLLADPTEGVPGGSGLSQRLIRTEESTPPLPGGLVDGRATFGYADPLADHPDHSADFVPPTPPPVPRPRDRIAKAAWFAVIGGPLLLILRAVFGMPSILNTVGLILFFGGFATLVFRMEDRLRAEDGGDDGAVV